MCDSKVMEIEWKIFTPIHIRLNVDVRTFQFRAPEVCYSDVFAGTVLDYVRLSFDVTYRRRFVGELV